MQVYKPVLDVHVFKYDAHRILGLYIYLSNII